MEHEYVKKTRRWLHQHPELSMQEFETTAFIKRELDALGIPYDTPLATGVVAYLEGTAERAIAFRADIDALPIHEENEVDYRSEVDNIMHACGHDGHTTMLLAFAGRVKKLYDAGQLASTIYFIFQPSEETEAGANQLLKAYTFRKKPSYIFGLHMMPDNAEGEILSKPGPITASATEYRFFIKGLSAHVANKEQGHSAGEALSFVLTQVAQIQQFHLPGLRHNIVHIGQFHAGEAINTVPSNGYLEGTIRTYHADDLAVVKEQMMKIAEACTTLTGAQVEVKFSDGYPSTYNHEEAYAFMKSASEDTSLQFIEKDEPYLFGEDFAFYGDVAPTAFAFLGCRNVDKHFVTGLHTPTLNFDEQVLLGGIDLFSAILTRFEAVQ
ncbi:M20 metallopeptidase family protein [Macrococcus brunensis]|uniref:M20 metallopeptidase family protein n=1 Tax=Macrococcus brunensis TaxID=198483 RepID=UPI001EF0E6D1|nr:M20 family metallopeptidase [Macrococcus brunensis]ULG74536.1 M20 family metallopeptidase [Macrococcus brunensis]